MNGNLYKNKYRQQTHRCKNYDYGSNGSYFVTINTFNQKKYFGHIVTTDNCPSLQPTPIGVIVNDYWLQIPIHYPFVTLDTYIIMPNHLHGILTFNKPGKSTFAPNTFGRQSENLGAVIRGFKATVKRYANIHTINFFWQPGYHDIIIRTDDELLNIRKYIMMNPYKSTVNKAIPLSR